MTEVLQLREPLDRLDLATGYYAVLDHGGDTITLCRVGEDNEGVLCRVFARTFTVTTGDLEHFEATGLPAR